jgi:hypothetical protein
MVVADARALSGSWARFASGSLRRARLPRLSWPIRPPPARSGWEFSLTPYAWMVNLNGRVTARAQVNMDFFQIVEDSDSFLA